MSGPEETVAVRLRFLPKNWAAVLDTAALLDMNAATVVNRAVQLYAFIEMERRAADADLALIQADGSVHRVSFDDDPPEVKARFEQVWLRSRRWPWKRRAS